MEGIRSKPEINYWDFFFAITSSGQRTNFTVSLYKFGFIFNLDNICRLISLALFLCSKHSLFKIELAAILMDFF